MRAKITVTSDDGELKSRDYDITAQGWQRWQKSELVAFVQKCIIDERAKKKDKP